MMLRSKRFALRRLHSSDAEFVRSVYADARVTAGLLQVQRPISIEQARDFCRASGRGDHRFGAVLRAEDRLIAVGTVRAKGGVASIGYSLVPAYWSQGLGSELAAMLVEFAFDTLGVSEVRATTLEENPASARVLEKIGFTVAASGATEIDSLGETRRVTRWSLRPTAVP